MTYSRQGNLSTRCKARARRPAAPRCSCALPAAICGAGWRRIAPRRSATSATPILSAPTGRAAANSPMRPALARAVAAQWPERRGQALCRLHRRRAALQLDEALIAALHAEGFEIGIETNGTLLPPPGIDWICVSPKADAEQKLTRGDELKLIYPQAGARAGALCRPGFPQFLPAADGQCRTAPPTPRPRPLLPGASAMAAVACKPTNCIGIR